MKRALITPRNNNQFKKWGWLTFAIIIAMSSSGCQSKSVSGIISSASTSSINNKANWTTYTDGNTVKSLFVKDNDLWVATDGGIVKWDIDAGTYEKYTTSDGIINNEINGITQDKTGDLWFITMGGLIKYDGISWQNIYNDTFFGSGLSITSNNQNNIYIGLWDGSVYRFNGKLEEIKSPGETTQGGASAAQRGITSLAIDKNNKLWSVGDDGIQRFDGKSWVDSKDIPGFPEEAVDFIGADKNNDLWFQDYSDLSSSYLYCYDGTSWQKMGIQFTDSNAQSITIDNNGNLWCATIGILNRYDGKTWQTFKCPVVGIDSIVADNQGNIWCGAYLNGVLRFDGKSWKTYVTNDTPGINGPTFIANDNAGNTWFSTDYGLILFDGKNWEMVNNEIVDAACFVQDKQGDLWFGSMNNVYRYDGKSWDVFNIGHEPFETITSIVEDNSGNIFAGSYNYIYKYDGKSWTSRDIRDIFGVALTNIQVNSIMIDDQNTIWVATSNGIMHFDGSNWKVYTSDDGLADNYISKVIQDKSGNIWSYGFYSGLNLYNGRSWQYFISDDRIVDNAQDKNGNIWVATNHGVFRYDGSSFQIFTTADGLLDNSVNSIVIDNNNNVWCGTGYGINYFNGKSWQSMTTSEGLVGNDIWQIVKDTSGDIWLNSYGGISRYTPTK